MAAVRDRLLSQLSRVHGISHKVIHMALADLLIGAERKRKGWVATGQGMIAVDSLVHNFLHRSGILATFDAVHGFGACYGRRGCFRVLDVIASQVDASQFRPTYPASFPRFTQYALWHFRAEGGRAICNGRNIDDSRRCQQKDCPVYQRCGRVALRG